MPQSIAGQLQSIPMSSSLSQSLGRAQDFAREQSHRALMLEHLLLALTEDPDAAGVLRACNVDIDRLGADVSGYLGGLLEDMRAPQGTEPAPDSELMRVVEAARLAAQQSRRRAIDGAIVLAAIVGDAKSPAAGLLKAHGMTFEEAIRTLQKASAQARTKQYSASSRPPAEGPAPEPVVEKPAPAPVPSPMPAPASAWSTPAPSPTPDALAAGQTADEILAAARARIQQRSGPPASKPEAKPSAQPTQAAPAEPETLPLMSLSSFTPSGPPGPVPADLPPMLGRPHGPPGPPDQSGPPTSPPPSPSGAPARPMGSEPPLGPPRAFGPGEGGPPRPPPMQGPPPKQGGPAPPRLPERLQRADAADGTGPPTRRPPPPVGPNGALPGQRRSAGDAARPVTRPAGPGRGGQRGAAGPLIETIPRRMRMGSATVAQVRIGRDKVDALMQLLTGNRALVPPEATMARVLSVRLRAPDGGFAIEADTPEARWVEAGQPQDEPIAWQWEVTPLRRGRQPLQLLVSARIVGRDGITPETAPPDRTVEVVVRGGRFGRIARFVGLLVLLGAGIGLGRLSQDKLAQDVIDVGAALINNVLGLLRTSGFLSG